MPTILCVYCEYITGPVPDLITAWGRMEDHEDRVHPGEGEE